jgi:phage gpG-like protein
VAKTQVILRFDQYAARLREAAVAGMDSAANEVANQVRVNLSKPGRFKSFWSQASKSQKRYVREYGFVDPPGGMPRLRSGNLQKSVTYDRPTALRRRIGPNNTIKYGRIHELGGSAGNGSYIPARPYLRPALVTAGPRAARLFSQVVRAKMRGVRVMT